MSTDIQKFILILEDKNILCTKLHQIMMDLKTSLESRQEQKFFGAKVKDALKYLYASTKAKVIEDFNGVYVQALLYFNKWYKENSFF